MSHSHANIHSVSLCHPALSFVRHAEAQTTNPSIFTSSEDVPLLQYPEGITAWNGHVFVGTYNFVNPSDARILVLNAKTGALQHTIGGSAGQELVSAGPLLGLTIDQRTGDLFAAANGAGYIL